MQQVTDLTPAWPAPTTPKPVHPWIKLALVGTGIFAATVAAGLVVLHRPAVSHPDSGGSFYAQAGWSIQRAADLSVKMRRDDGASKTTADCAMKTIVGSTTWLEWQSLSAYGQLAAIRTAERAC